jgi:hypothetical protein
VIDRARIIVRLGWWGCWVILVGQIGWFVLLAALGRSSSGISDPRDMGVVWWASQSISVVSAVLVPFILWATLAALIEIYDQLAEDTDDLEPDLTDGEADD